MRTIGIALLYFLVCANAQAQQDISSIRMMLLKAVDQTCQQQFLEHPETVTFLTANHMLMADVCQCAASMFVSSLNETQARLLFDRGATGRIAQHLLNTERLCIFSARR